MIEEPGFGGKAKCEIGLKVPETGHGEVKADTAEVFQTHLLWVFISQHVPIAQELKLNWRSNTAHKYTSINKYY